MLRVEKGKEQTDGYGGNLGRAQLLVNFQVPFVTDLKSLVRPDRQVLLRKERGKMLKEPIQPTLGRLVIGTGVTNKNGCC